MQAAVSCSGMCWPHELGLTPGLSGGPAGEGVAEGQRLLLFLAGAEREGAARSPVSGAFAVRRLRLSVGRRLPGSVPARL